MTMPKFSAVKVPLSGWQCQIWVETLRQWHTMRGSPIFDNPDHAIHWGMDQWGISA